jgi:hypothetical protein
LADDGGRDRRMLQVVLKIMGLMAQFAQRNGVRELLVTVHPRHSKFYRNFVAFQPLGDERPCLHVCNEPALALRLDLARLPIDDPVVYRRFFGEPFPDQLLEPQPIPVEQRAYFRQFLEPSTISPVPATQDERESAAHILPVKPRELADQEKRAA